MSDPRRPFDQPLGLQELERLTDGELSTFVRFSGFEWLRFRYLSLDRWRWRRAHSRAFRMFAERVRQHAGPPPALCQSCAEQPAKTHWAYGEGASLRFGHFCKACAQYQQPGWLAVSVHTEARHSDAPGNIR